MSYCSFPCLSSFPFPPFSISFSSFSIPILMMDATQLARCFFSHNSFHHLHNPSRNMKPSCHNLFKRQQYAMERKLIVSCKHTQNGFHLQQLEATPALIPSPRSNGLMPESAGFFYLPQISSSLPLKLHPSYGAVKDRVDEWVVMSGIASSTSEEEVEAMKQWNVPLAMCLCNPEASMERLILATQLMLWMGLADDMLDEHCMAPGEEKIEAEAICSVLDGAIAETDVQGRSMKEFCHLWRRLSGEMHDEQRERFVKSMKECLCSLAKLQSNKCPSVEEYIKLRRVSGGVYPMFILQEFALGIDALVRDDEDKAWIEEIEAAAADHIVWVNDLLSFRKEYLKGCHSNLPSLICKSEECNLQEAVYRICDMIEAKEREFLELVKKKEKKKKKKKMESLGYFMSGNLHWSLITPRYHGVNNMSKYQHGLFQLRPDKTVITPLCLPSFL